jgi:hypothetical protein
VKKEEKNEPSNLYKTLRDLKFGFAGFGFTPNEEYIDILPGNAI